MDREILEVEVLIDNPMNCAYSGWFEKGVIIEVYEGSVGHSQDAYDIVDYDKYDNCWVKKAHVSIVEDVTLGGE